MNIKELFINYLKENFETKEKIESIIQNIQIFHEKINKEEKYFYSCDLDTFNNYIDEVLLIAEKNKVRPKVIIKNFKNDNKYFYNFLINIYKEPEIDNSKIEDIFITNTSGNITNKLKYIYESDKLNYKNIIKNKKEATIVFDLTTTKAQIIQSDGQKYEKDEHTYFRHPSNENNKYFAYKEDSIIDLSNLYTSYDCLFRLSKYTNRIIESSINDLSNLYITSFDKVFCLFPDIVDAFNRDLRSQINFNGNHVFQIPRSVALLLSLQLKGYNFKEDEPYYVFSFDEKDFYIVKCSFKKVDDYDKLVITRMGVEDFSEAYGFKNISNLYIKEYIKRYKLDLSDYDILDIINSNLLFNIFLNKKEQVLRLDYDYISIKYDYDIFNKCVAREIIECINNYANYIDINKDHIFVLNSYMQDSSFYNYKDCFDGAQEIIRRIKTHEPLWFEYLPKLSLEVINNGRYEDLELIEENQYKDVLQVLNSEEIIPVNGKIMLSKGKEQYKLPLHRRVVGDFNSNKIAYIKHDSFPLDEDVEASLEIHYNYGDEESYKLYFKPYNADSAPFDLIKNEWKDIEQIEKLSLPKVNFDSNIIDLSQYKGRAIYAIHNGIKRIDKILNDIYYDPNRLNKIQFIQNTITNKMEADIFSDFNNYYKYRRIIFKDGTSLNTDELDELNEIFYDMIYILKDKRFENVFRNNKSDYKKLCNNIKDLISDMDVFFYNSIYEDDNKDIPNLIYDFYTNNEIDYLIKISRYLIEDEYNTFNYISDILYRKFNGYSPSRKIMILRTMSSNCWEFGDWIKNLYLSDYGREVIKILTNYIIEIFNELDLNPYIDEILDNKEINLLWVRDILELFLCLLRSQDYFDEDDDSLINPNDKIILVFINNLKILDSFIYEYGYFLKKPLISRIKAKFDKKELYSMNDTIYMVIQALSGGDNVELIGFEEE